MTEWLWRPCRGAWGQFDEVAALVTEVVHRHCGRTPERDGTSLIVEGVIGRATLAFDRRGGAWSIEARDDGATRDPLASPIPAVLHVLSRRGRLFVAYEGRRWPCAGRVERPIGDAACAALLGAVRAQDGLPLVMVGGTSPHHGRPLRPEQILPVVAGAAGRVVSITGRQAHHLNDLGWRAAPYAGAVVVVRGGEVVGRWLSATLKDAPRRSLREIQQTVCRGILPLHDGTPPESADDAPVPTVRTTDGYPRSWDEFARWAERRFGDRLLLSPRARRGLETACYERPEVAAVALEWLVERHGRGAPPVAGLRLGPTGQIAPECRIGTRTVRGDFKVARGNARDPRRCLRIYWTLDEARGRVVVVDMPQHARNRLT